MKEKLKRFFIEKKELLIFIGVVVFVFAAVIGIASLAINSSNNTEIPQQPDNNSPEEPVDTTGDDVVEPVVEPKFSLPIIGDYNIVRTFFDASLEKEELQTAVIIDSNGSLTTSTGMSFAKEDNSNFDVLAIYSGKVVNVINDELAGATIEIDHGNNVISIYSSLKDVNVKLGDEINQGSVIAKASESINDTSANVHLHLEIMVNGKYYNPDNIFGKEITEIIDMK